MALRPNIPRGEPSWHKRAFVKRRRAREAALNPLKHTISRLVEAKQLLDRHHGSTARKSLTNSFSVMAPKFYEFKCGWQVSGRTTVKKVKAAGPAFAGNIKQCFLELNIANKGHISLQDLDPETYDTLTNFRKLLLDRYGNYLDAWTAMDKNRNGKIEERELISICRELGYEGDGKHLFRCLVDGPGKQQYVLRPCTVAYKPCEARNGLITRYKALCGLRSPHKKEAS